MLRNDFYTIHDDLNTGNELTCRLVFNQEHAIFKGHFPGNPVVPGVCMMEIVKELLQSQLNTPLVLTAAGNVKFLQLITPQLEPSMRIEWTEKETGYAVKASIHTGSSVFFKMDGNYTPGQ